MFAIVRISGQQFKVAPDSVLRVPRMDAEVGGAITIEEVLLWVDGDSVEVGKPFIEGKALKAEVIRHGKAKKIIVFKKKRRKNYRRKNGHRQDFTDIRVTKFAG